MSAPVVRLYAPTSPGAGPSAAPAIDPTPLSAQLPRGRLVELSGDRRSAHLTAAVACLGHAQRQGETTAWIQPEGGPLFPPDLAESGVDLGALVVVHVPRVAGAVGLLRAAELLLRSGGFGFVLLDLGAEPPQASGAWPGRLLGLAREHDAWLLLLRDRTPLTGPPVASASGRGSLGPLVSLCLHPTRARTAPGRFTLEVEVYKDKSGSLRPLAPELRRGPWGVG